MSDSHTFSPCRLNQARRLKSWSLDDLAAELARVGVRISKQSLSKYEKGDIVPSSSNWVMLSKVLAKPMDFFAQPGALRLSEIDYRRVKSRLSAKAEARIVAKAELYFEDYLKLEQLFGLPKVSWRSKYRVSNCQEAVAAANHLRNEWDLGVDPIPSVTNLLESKHIKICRVDEDEAFDALRAYAKGELVICSNKKRLKDDIQKRLDLPRMRFTILHELGHDVMQITDDTLSQLERERLCNRFAGAFLLPEESLKKEFYSSVQKKRQISKIKLIEIKQKYGISIAALGMRMFQCGMMTQQSHKSFSIQYNRAGYGRRCDEPGRYEGSEVPTRMMGLIADAYSEERIDRFQANSYAEAAGMTADELGQLLEIW